MLFYRSSGLLKEYYFVKSKGGYQLCSGRCGVWDSRLVIGGFVSESNEINSHRESHRFICVDVEDDGPGIPGDFRCEVMKPFVRIDPGSQDKDQASSHSGLGLGLAIVNRILQQHGGSVQIDRGELGGCLVNTRWPSG